MPVAQKVSDKDYTYHVTKAEMESPTTTTSSSSPSSESTESKAQQAYDPETNTINWDCPCIAGMVEPPCGDYFKAAFSCFVYSTTEPKGSDCLKEFREMQACFAEHPEKYAAKDEDE